MEEDKAILLQTLLLEIIKRQVKPEALQWLEEKGRVIANDTGTSLLSAFFAAVPRKIKGAIAEISANELQQIDQLYNGFTIKNWPLDKLSRLWLLLQVDATDQHLYCSRIEALFRYAEMNELATLYAALPVFAYADTWQFRTTEGIRSNIGTVLEAIMYENPYPCKSLSEPSWNQLVLKAFFTDKDINRIIGLEERSNKALSTILIDYAHERQAAHRIVSPQLWRLVSKFIDEKSIVDIENLFNDVNVIVRRAAVLACYCSNYEPAKRLMNREPLILEAVKANQLTWNSL